MEESAEHRSLRRQVTRATRHGRNAHWRQVAEDTERAAAVVDTQKPYQLVKQACRDKASSNDTLLDRAGGLVTSLGEQLKR